MTKSLQDKIDFLDGIEMMSPETMKIMKDRIAKVEDGSCKVILVGEQIQVQPLKEPRFSENQWTKILTTKAKYVGDNNDW